MFKFLKPLTILCLSVLLFSCNAYKSSTTKRTAQEQLLLTESIDRAVEKLNFTPLKGKKVFFDTKYLKSIENAYLTSAIRNKISSNKAILVNSEKDCDIIVEPRCGALAIDESNSLFGIPSMNVPVPLAGQVKTPEIYFYKSHKQRSINKLAYYARKKDGTFYHEESEAIGIAKLNRYWILIFSFKKSDLPVK